MRYKRKVRDFKVDKYLYEEQRKRRQKRLRRQRMLHLVLIVSIPFFLLCAGIGVCCVWELLWKPKAPVMAYDIKYIAQEPDYVVELLDINEYSRPGTSITEINGIVIHYTANPGTTAEQNRSYFQNLKDTKETHASSHFVIGIEGEIVQCIPCNEIAYASNERNSDTISIECCIPDETGKFTDATYQSLVELATWLIGRYDLTTEDVIRHYDVTGKACPKYYVENELEWMKLKEDLLTYIDRNGIAKTEQIQ